MASAPLKPILKYSYLKHNADLGDTMGWYLGQMVKVSNLDGSNPRIMTTKEAFKLLDEWVSPNSTEPPTSEN